MPLEQFPAEGTVVVVSAGALSVTDAPAQIVVSCVIMVAVHGVEDWALYSADISDWVKARFQKPMSSSLPFRN